MVDDDLDLLLFGVFQLPGGRALKYPRGLRAITLMTLPPRRRDVRQQSIAVLLTPMMRTRSPIWVVCPKATEPSQSIPM